MPHDFAGQLLVLGRIDLRQSVGQDADRPAAGLERSAVRGRVDPAGQSRDDGKADPGQGGSQAAGHPHAVGGAPPRTDQRNGQVVPRLE